MKKLFLKKILYCTAIPVMSISPLFAQQEMNEMWGEQQAKAVQAGNERGHLFEWGNYAMFIHWGLFSQPFVQPERFRCDEDCPIGERCRNEIHYHYQ